ncbi:MAG: nucleoside-triphosphatase [Bacteroidota bacterium]
MNEKTELSETWIKASITGTIWAASEIVLGSFLHNLKVPFSGNILTAIGIIILISISFSWKDKGLFWRAGLICAIMKTMSPSAVIFGPMIAILSEALLLELSVRLLGKSYFSYIIGAMLAMSWNLFQKIINFILFYGFNIVELYKNLVKYAEKQLQIPFDLVWMPLIALLVVYCVLGLVSAIIGIRVGRKIVIQPAEKLDSITTGSFAGKTARTESPFPYSISWLFADILLIVSSLILLNQTTWVFWSISITAVTVAWALRYKRALRQLSKPKFWIFFVLITMITAFAFTLIQPGAHSLTQGLLTGLQMNFRAVIIIVGFAVLGTELYNPVIRAFFLKTSFKQLPLALELSFESLPLMIASIPDFRTILKNPVSVLYRVVSVAEFRLSEIQTKQAKKIFITSGKVGEGKTTQLQQIVALLKQKGITVGGILSPRIMENKETLGYDIIDIVNDAREIFLRKNADGKLKKIGRYGILPKGLLLGKGALSASKNRRNKIVVIDEVGMLELENQGWALQIADLIAASDSHLLLAVRDSLTEQVVLKWNLQVYAVYTLAEFDHEKACHSILEAIS